jgi:hypothetical protein
VRQHLMYRWSAATAKNNLSQMTMTLTMNLVTVPLVKSASACRGYLATRCTE